jgi:hypothetical protein
MGDETPDTAGRPSGRWSAVLGWPLLVLLGWLLFELTAQPGLGAAVLCLKLGWEDFRTAWWLRRRDPWRGRGRACFWMYVASGWWKVGLTAFGVLLLCAVLTPKAQQQAGQPPPPEVIAAFLTGVAGGLFMLVTTGWALWLARWHRVRVWLNPAVHQARRWDLWPPSQVQEQKGNSAGCLVISVLIPVLLVGLVLLGIGAAVVMQGNRGGGQAVVAIIAITLGMVGGSVAMLLVSDLLQKHLLAGRAEECWPLDEPDVGAAAFARAGRLSPERLE